MKKIHRILINRTDALGDTILTLPIAQLLKEYIPSCEITFLVKKSNGELFDNLPYVHHVFLWDPQDSLREKYKKFREYYKKIPFDTYIYVGGDHWVSFFCALKGVPNRAGLKSRWPSFLFLNMGLRQKRSRVQMHEIEYNLALLRVFGIFFKGKIFPRLEVSQEEKEQGKKILGVKKPFIVIHPGMRGHTLNWSPSQYAHLVLYMEKRYPHFYEYVVSYTPAEIDIIEQFQEEIKNKWEKNSKLKIIYFNGSLSSLRVYMGILASATLYIGGSTGPTHLANALGSWIFTIYSPIKVQSALRWGPLGEASRVHISVPHAICGETYKCAGEKCLYFYCFSHMDVYSAFEEIEKLLENRKKYLLTFSTGSEDQSGPKGDEQW